MANLIRLKRILAATFVLVIAVFSILPTAGVASARSLIRDAEIENTIREYATPVLRAAGLDPKQVHIYIVQDKTMNAFVAGGQRIFVTTGLLRATEHPGQLIGVLAHETGHIAGGHLARLEGALQDASTEAMIGSLLGLAVGVLSGSPEAAAAGMSLGTHIATRNLLAFSVAQERSADRAALTFLDKTHQSAKGLMEFLNTIHDQELMFVSDKTQRENTYTTTHPLTNDRIAFVEDHVLHSPYSDIPDPPALVALHARIVAKLDGFLDPPGRTFAKYRSTDHSVAARYARAIAYYKMVNIPEALSLLDGLIQEDPKNPYYWELKGQILFENGRLEEALPAYNRANTLLPGEPLLLVARAHVEIELNRDALVKPALATLKSALQKDPDMPFAWRLAAVAYGRLDEMGMAYLASAEYGLARGDKKAARDFATRAKRQLKRGSRGWLRAEDILLSVGKEKQPRGNPRDRRRRDN